MLSSLRTAPGSRWRSGRPGQPCEADCLRGKRVTSWPSLRTDIRNAGGEWVDRQTVIDGNLLTSRKPDDLPAFNEESLQALASRTAARSSG